jgi:hypothetical protein
VTSTAGSSRWPRRARSTIDILVLGLGWIGVAALAIYLGRQARVVASWGDGKEEYGAPDQLLSLMASLQLWAVIPVLLWIVIAFLLCRAKAGPLGVFALGVLLCDLLYVLGVYLWINTGLMAVSV